MGDKRMPKMVKNIENIFELVWLDIRPPPPPPPPPRKHARGQSMKPIRPICFSSYMFEHVLRSRFPPFSRGYGVSVLSTFSPIWTLDSPGKLSRQCWCHISFMTHEKTITLNHNKNIEFGPKTKNNNKESLPLTV